jgi:hypothetical protein
VDGGTFIDVASGSQAGSTVNFVGISANTMPFDRVAFQTTDAGDGIYLDRVQFNAIPEAQSVIIWLALCGIAFAAWSKRAIRAP